MKLANKIGIIVLCLFSCLAIGLQVIYEKGAVIQGFAVSRVFLAIFWWQIVSVPLILIATLLGVFKENRFISVALTTILLSSIYPTWTALYALWPSNWPGWLSTFKDFPRDGVLELSIVLLPAFFPLSLAAIFLNQIRTRHIH